ncbi:MAG: cytochrome b [Xanthobacteraceae bacterium]|jgi:cytochrome b561
MSATAWPAAAAGRYNYTGVQRGLHWLMAAIIVVAFGLGVWSAYLAPGTPVRVALLDVHKSLGMTALVLLALRVGCRLALGEPPYRKPLDRLSRIGAHMAHGLLYLLMLFMPLSGYVYSASGGHSLPWFGLFSWPQLVPRDKAAEALGQTLHHWGAWVIGALLLVHGLAVVWHVFVKKDEVLSRMAP